MFRSINGSKGDAGAGATSEGGTAHDTGGDDAAYDSVGRLWLTTLDDMMWGEGGSSPGGTARVTTLSSGGTSSEGVGGGEPSPPGRKSSNGAHQLQATAATRDRTHHERSTVAEKRWLDWVSGRDKNGHVPNCVSGRDKNGYVPMSTEEEHLMNVWQADCGVCNTPDNQTLIWCVRFIVGDLIRPTEGPGPRPAILQSTLNKIEQIRQLVYEIGVHRKGKPGGGRTDGEVEKGTKKLVCNLLGLFIKVVTEAQVEALQKKVNALQEENKALKEENKALKAKEAQDMGGYRAAAEEGHKELEMLAKATDAALRTSSSRIDMFRHRGRRPNGGVSNPHTVGVRPPPGAK